jgi:hypothetical protein
MADFTGYTAPYAGPLGHTGTLAMNRARLCRLRCAKSAASTATAARS